VSTFPPVQGGRRKEKGDGGGNSEASGGLPRKKINLKKRGSLNICSKGGEGKGKSCVLPSLVSKSGGRKTEEGKKRGRESIQDSLARGKENGVTRPWCEFKKRT